MKLKGASAREFWGALTGALLLSWSGATLAQVPAATPAPAPSPSPAPQAVVPAAAPTSPVAADAAVAPVAAAPVAATPEPAHVPAEGTQDVDTGVAAPKKKKKKHEQEQNTALGHFVFKGRVLALAELARSRPATFKPMESSLGIEVDSARVGVEYEAPIRWLSAVAELELTGRPELKDGFVQARGRHFWARAGQFKLPVSVFELESPWTLPTVHRGLIHDLLTEWLDLGDRRPGMLFGYRGRGGLRPRLSLGAFQAAEVTNSAWDVEGDRDLELVERPTLKSQSIVGRAQLEVGPVEIGAWSQLRAAAPAFGRNKYYLAGGADAALDRLLPGGGVRLWLDVIAGSSWYEHNSKPLDLDPAIFGTARALFAYRLGGTVDDAPYVEAFGFFGLFEPDFDVSRDTLWEASVGVAAGYWRRARVTLQAEGRDHASRFPRATGGYYSSIDLERWSLLLQAGMAF